MKPIDKAKELCEKFNVKTCIIYTEDSIPNRKCEHKTTKSVIEDAIICVDVILNDCGAKDWSGDEACDGKNYWLEVRKYLETFYK